MVKATSAAPAVGGVSRIYAAYVLGVLFLVNAFNIVDRSIMGLLVDPVKAEMVLSDTQMGILTGFAFVAFYLVFGIWLARVADRGSRRILLTVGIVIWSIATASSGLATDYNSLLAARMAVAIGEAACFPVAMSLIGDYFPRTERARAVAIFQASQYVGIIVGLVLIGIITEAFGWRTAFLAVGLPGLLVAGLFFLTVREPQRGRHDPQSEAPETSLLASARMIFGNGTLLGLIVVMGIGTMGLLTLASWSPPFLQRIHGLSVGNVGKILGPAIGLPGIIGTVGGGFLASWLVKRSGRERSALLVPLVGLPLSVPAFSTFVFADQLPLAIAGLGVGNMFVSTVFGPIVAAALSLSAPRMRALTASFILVAQNLIGGGLGPYLVGVFSDSLAPSYGIYSIRYALIVVPVAPLLAALLLGLVYLGIGRRTRREETAGRVAAATTA